MANSDSVPGLIARARQSDPRSVARLLSRVEDGSADLPEIMNGLAQYTGNARVIGLTGSPGVGKSTSTSALVRHLRDRGERVGVLAVDPSSPFSGGALLGDRIRMQEHATDPMVFIRSMASRGHLGGIAAATPQAIRVLDAAGCDTIIVETVGVGQSEIEVVSVADTVLVLLAPGMGDGIQAAKAGILEIGDIFVVNKADRDGARQTARELRGMVRLASRAEGDWQPPVLQTVASRDEGMAEVIEQIDAHLAWARGSGQLHVRRRARAAEEIEALALASVQRRWSSQSHDLLDDLAAKVAEGVLDPYSAADELLAARG